MIEARDLVKYYGAHAAVENVSFFVGEGETVGFLGANGAGKSTTMRMLTGFLAPTAGSAHIAGFNVEKDPISARRQLGYLPESTPLYTDMRVREFLEYRAKIKGLDRAHRVAEIAKALDMTATEKVSHRIIGQLSKGYRQRVGLADCLIGSPKIMILDEPTVGLDPNQVVETRNLIREIGRERTVFLSTHILHEVEMICQRVMIIKQGRIVAEGETAQLCKRYAPQRIVGLQLEGPDSIEGEVLALDGVVSLEKKNDAEDGIFSCKLTCEEGTDPRRAISELASNRNWMINELKLEPVRLEDIFTQLTTEGVS